MKYVYVDDAVKMLNTSKGTLDFKRYKKRFVPSARIGKRVLYSVDQINQFLEDEVYDTSNNKIIMFIGEGSPLAEFPYQINKSTDDCEIIFFDTSLHICCALEDEIFKSLVDGIVSRRVYTLILLEEDFEGNEFLLEFLENLCKSARVLCSVTDRVETIEIINSDGEVLQYEE
ncbi:MerR family transcriptional regulator [[Clostridium] fimetarium]|uniref:Helix-turn-helix domain-containing protein n=1 Tax=[Clostridium] fimetarium TaxID=99656 RepID=A0A1I0RD78_9FIRM|nr:helix-turn-helix domain-containing protein [[Clostridium] fimetarium]SEW38819.1 hypothetical protein SAMN05421659_11445 [[Clostridium] fimetarium]